MWRRALAIENLDGSLDPFEASIDAPTQDDLNRWYCSVICPPARSVPMRIYGSDPLDALYLAIRHLETMIRIVQNDAKVVWPNRSLYVSPY
jgi:hypothetical protein